MHYSIQNLETIKEEVKLNCKSKILPNIIAVSKTFPIDKINPLIEYGHKHFGENKVQEANSKWRAIKDKNDEIKLHLIGSLQTNKVNLAVEIFDYIHSVDSKKLAKKISDTQLKKNKSLKIFLQINIGDENQKSGINQDGLPELINFCKDLNLDVIGLMCIPPVTENAEIFFKKLYSLNLKYNFNQLSMGMSSDYLKAVENHSTFLRIGSKIFGNRI